MAYLLGEPTVQQYFDANGDPLANGTIEFFIWNTSTPTAVYSDSSGTSLGTSVTLNSIGAPQSGGGTAVALFFDDSVTYKIVRKDSGGTAIDPTIGPFKVIPDVSTQSVDDLAGLQGVTISSFTGGEIRYMKGRASVGDGGEGAFIWRTGDKSTEVAADEVTTSGGNGGVWIAPTSDLTGASGAWERVGVTSINVKWYGAAGDGATDDSTPIQAAIDYWKTLLSGEAGDGFTEYGATLLFPGQGLRYKHATSLDFTGIRTKGARVVFEGSALLSTCTGAAAVDAVNSRYVDWVNLHIIGDATTPPDFGILLARNSTGNVAGAQKFDGLTLVGHFEKAALCNYGSEVNTYNATRIWNYSDSATSYGAVISRTNILSASSSYETIDTAEESTNDNFFFGLDLRKFNDGRCVRLDAVRNVYMRGYMSYGGTFPSARDSHIWITTEGTQRSTGLDFDLHFENPSVTVNACVEYENTTTNNTIFGLKIRDFLPQAASYLRFAGSAQGVSDLKIEGFISSSITAFSDDGATNSAVRQAEVRNYSITEDAGCINLTNLSSFSGEIHTFSPADVAATSSVIATTADINTASRKIRYEGRDVTTIASGAITLASNYIDIKGEGGASDDLDNINGTFFDGEVITIVNTDAADTITVKHNTGNIWNPALADVALGFRDIVRLKYISNLTKWIVL